ncbi:MAG: 50S ribosomal protein L10 [Dehalococcoidia bacterium]|nr:50S ribosomal protein L10 [Dehalococcoidia bacterium]
MAREKKTQLIERIAEEIAKSQIVVVTDYRGLPAKELTVLRRAVSKADGRYMVVKNTLATLAARKAGNEEIIKLLSGPVGLAFGYGEVTQTVKVIQEHIKTTGSVLQIKGGVLGGRVLGKSDLLALATLPSREVLVAQLLAALKSPVQRLHFVLSAPLRNLVGVIQARAKQLEAGGKTAIAG